MCTIRLLASTALICLGLGANAQTSGNINVTATVAASCTIAVNPITFGTYDPMSATAAQGSGTVALTCTQGSVPVVALSGGSNLVGSQRKMKDTAVGGTALLNYAIYQPTSNAASASCAYTTVWGNGTVGTAFTATAAPDLSARTYNVCGQISAGQNVPVGSYADVVAAAVSF